MPQANVCATKEERLEWMRLCAERDRVARTTMSGAVKSNSFTTEVYQATDIDTSDVQDVDSWNRINMGGYL